MDKRRYKYIYYSDVRTSTRVLASRGFMVLEAPPGVNFFGTESDRTIDTHEGRITKVVDIPLNHECYFNPHIRKSRSYEGRNGGPRREDDDL